MSDACEPAPGLLARTAGWFANPVVLRELRGRMRGSRAFIVLGVFVLGEAAWFVFLYYVGLVEAFDRAHSYDQALAGIGRSAFLALLGGLGFLVAVATPPVCAGPLALERDRKTLEFLRLTLLSPFQIVLGKLVGGLAYVALLLATSLPVVGLVFLLGGVAPLEVLASYLMLLLGALVLGALCVCLASFATTAWSTSPLYGIVVFFFTMPLLGNLTRGRGSSGASLPFLAPVPWFGLDLPALVPVGVLAVVTSVALLHAAAGALRQGDADDSVGERLSAGVATVALVATVLGFDTYKNASDARGFHVLALVAELAALAAIAPAFCLRRPPTREVESAGTRGPRLGDVLRDRVLTAPSYAALVALACGAVAVFDASVRGRALPAVADLPEVLVRGHAVVVLFAMAAFGALVCGTLAFRLVTPRAMPPGLRVVAAGLLLGVTYFATPVAYLLVQGLPPGSFVDGALVASYWISPATTLLHGLDTMTGSSGMKFVPGPVPIWMGALGAQLAAVLVVAGLGRFLRRGLAVRLAAWRREAAVEAGGGAP